MADRSKLEDIYPDRFDHNQNTFTLTSFENNISPEVNLMIVIYDREQHQIINRDDHPELFVMLRQPVNQHIQFNRFIVCEMPAQTPILLNIIDDLNLELRLASHNRETGRCGDILMELLYY